MDSKKEFEALEAWFSFGYVCGCLQILNYWFWDMFQFFSLDILALGYVTKNKNFV